MHALCLFLLFAVEPLEHQRGIAAAMGAHVVPDADDDVHVALAEVTGGPGVDVAF